MSLRQIWNGSVCLLFWRRSQNGRAWGIRMRYHVGRFILEYRTLFSCGSGLGAYCVGDGDGCRYVGVDINLGWVMEAWRSLMRLFIIILIDPLVQFF